MGDSNFALWETQGEVLSHRAKLSPIYTCKAHPAIVHEFSYGKCTSLLSLSEYRYKIVKISQVISALLYIGKGSFIQPSFLDHDSVMLL